MSKYICLCGMTFKRKKLADLHLSIFEHEDLQNGYPSHKIFNQHWQARLLEWFLGIDLIYYLAFMAGVIINALLVSHSGLTDGERIVEAVCMGIILMRLFKNERR